MIKYGEGIHKSYLLGAKLAVASGECSFNALSPLGSLWPKGSGIAQNRFGGEDGESLF